MRRDNNRCLYLYEQLCTIEYNMLCNVYCTVINNSSINGTNQYNNNIVSDTGSR